MPTGLHSRSIALAVSAVVVTAVGALWGPSSQAAEPVKPAPAAKPAADPFADEPTAKPAATPVAPVSPPVSAAPASSSAPANNPAPATNNAPVIEPGLLPIVPIPGAGLSATPPPSNPKTPDPFSEVPPPAQTTPGTTTPNTLATPLPTGLIANPVPGTQPAATAPATSQPAATQPATPATTPSTPPTTTPPSTANPPVDVKLPEGEPTPGLIEFKMGEDLLKAGKYAAAVEQFKRASKLNPDDPPTHFNLGVCYRMLNRLDDAVTEFTTAIHLDPDLGEAYLRRGICWFYKGEYELSTLDCDDAASSNLSDPRPATWKAMALVQEGKLIDAINTYSIALRFDNHFVLRMSIEGWRTTRSRIMPERWPISTTQSRLLLTMPRSI